MSTMIITMALPVFRLWFDGEGGGAEGGGAAEAPTPISPRQIARAEAAAKEAETAEPEEKTPEQVAADRQKAWQDMISGEYKDLYDADVRRQIDRRFSEGQQNAQEVQRMRDMMSLLSIRYGTAEGDLDSLYNALRNDSAYLERAAYDAGVPVEEYQKREDVMVENRALHAQLAARESRERSWRETQLFSAKAAKEDMAKKYPGFNLADEINSDKDFLSLIRSGMPIERAYRMVHVEDLVKSTAESAAAATEKRVTDNVRARGARPQAAGAANNGFTARTDVHSLTKEQRADIARRAMRGEVITL